jgi:small multidrug resistance family-3 protein
VNKIYERAQHSNATRIMSASSADGGVSVGGMDTGDDKTGMDSFQWTAVTIVQAIALFLVAGVAEIGGGWLVWKSIRDDRPWWWAVIGSIVLVVYGFLPTLQPTDEFGRIYAVYGGFFIVLSFLAGWALDGDKPDRGDIVGGCIAMVGVLLILFWPR